MWRRSSAGSASSDRRRGAAGRAGFDPRPTSGQPGPMKLFWSSRSPFVRKVMIAAHELGLADRLELEPVVVALAQPNAAVMAHNPLNKIPTLITDDGQTLFESGLICEYLDGLATAPRLFPSAPALRWSALRWHALGTGLLEVLILWRSERMRPDGQRSDAVVV